MSKRTADSGKADAIKTGHRRTILISVAGGIAVVLVVGGLIWFGYHGSPADSVAGIVSHSSSGTPAPASSPGSGKSSAPTSPSTTKPNPSFGVPVAQTVERTAQADFGSGVSARILSLKPITATGTRPGEISGSAVQFGVEISNGTKASLNLLLVGVNCYYGSDKTPAAPVMGEGQSAGLKGSLASGKTATGTYIFTVPKDEVDNVTITVSSGTGDSVVVFR